MSLRPTAAARRPSEGEEETDGTPRSRLPTTASSSLPPPTRRSSASSASAATSASASSPLLPLTQATSKDKRILWSAQTGICKWSGWSMWSWCRATWARTENCGAHLSGLSLSLSLCPSTLSSLYLLPLSLLLRFTLSYLLHSTHLYSSLHSRLELSNSIVSLRHIHESLVNQAAGLSPYAGLSASHAPPVIIVLFQAILPVHSNGALEATGVEAFFSHHHLLLLMAFSVVDMLIALLLFSIGRDYYLRYPVLSLPIVMQQEQHQASAMVRHVGLVLAAVYLLNPLTLLSCLLFNTSHLTHLCVALTLWTAVKGKPFATSIMLACAAYLDIYPLLALLPVLLLLHKSMYAQRPDSFPQYRLDKLIQHDACRFVEGVEGEDENGLEGLVEEEVQAAKEQLQRRGFTPQRILRIAYQPVVLPESSVEEAQSILSDGSKRPWVDPRWNPPPPPAAKWNYMLLSTCVLMFLVTLGWLMGLSYYLNGSSFSFLLSSYGHSFMVPALSPTYSLFWYFFTSMFDRFHTFFLVVFHAHLLIYQLPLSKRMGGEEPLFLVALILHLGEVLRAYPALPQMAFTGMLLAVLNWPLLHSSVRRIYPMLFLNALSLLTLTLMQYLWLVSGSGNANFFYFQNLLFLFTQLFCVMECVGAVRRRQAALLEGQCYETIKRRKHGNSTHAGTNGTTATGGLHKED